MERARFHRLFKTTGPAVLPVIHVQSQAQAERNIELAISEGAQGVFLINHDFHFMELQPILLGVRQRFPYLWLGVNFLGIGGDVAFKILGNLSANGCHIDAYWADNAYIDERTGLDQQKKAREIKSIRESSGWDGLYFGGTAFKCQRPVADELVGKAASLAGHFMDVITTSGPATGVSANLQKITDMSRGCDGKALALASGVSPENASSYISYIDCFMTATSISVDFYNLDPGRLRSLVSVARGNKLKDTAVTSSSSPVRTDSWYLKLIAPNTRGDKFAWLDPTSIYIDSKAFADLTNDLLVQLNGIEIDLVAGIDAMGFPLGSAIATRLSKGFLAIRKAPRLCVEVETVSYSCYAGSGKEMEMRKNAFGAGTRVLVVDQWIETGGTMRGAIELITRQDGVIAALATICVEDNEKTKALCKEYKVIHVVPRQLQSLFDQHSFLGSEMNSY